MTIIAVLHGPSRQIRDLYFIMVDSFGHLYSLHPVVLKKSPYYISIIYTQLQFLKDFDVLMPKYSTYLAVKIGPVLLKFSLILTRNLVTVFLFRTT
jgi:hypothetical protein